MAATSARAATWAIYASRAGGLWGIKTRESGKYIVTEVQYRNYFGFSCGADKLNIANRAHLPSCYNPPKLPHSRELAMAQSVLVKELRQVVGDANVLNTPVHLQLYQYDAYLEERRPDAVVFVHSTEEV